MEILDLQWNIYRCLVRAINNSKSIKEVVNKLGVDETTVYRYMRVINLKYQKSDKEDSTMKVISLDKYRRFDGSLLEVPIV